MSKKIIEVPDIGTLQSTDKLPIDRGTGAFSTTVGEIRNIPEATPSSAGLMSSPDKRKLDHVAIMDSRWYGAIGDGTAHLFSEVYPTLSSAQTAFPLCHAKGWITSLSDYLDWAAIQEYILAEESNTSGYVQIGYGKFIINRSLLATGTNQGLIIEGRGKVATKILTDGNFVGLDARRSYLTLKSFGVVDVTDSAFTATTVAALASSKVGIYVGNAVAACTYVQLHDILCMNLYGGVHFFGGTGLSVTHSWFWFVKDYGFLQEDDWDVDTADKLFAHNYFKTIRDATFPNAAGLKITSGGGIKILDNTFQGFTHGILVDGKVAVNNGGSTLTGTVMLHIISNTFDNGPYNIRIRRGAANHTGYSSVLIGFNTFGVYNTADLNAPWPETFAIDIDGYETASHPMIGIKVIGNNSYTGGDYFCRINNVKQIDVAKNGSNGAFTTVYSIGSGVVGGTLEVGVHAAGYTTLLNNQSATVTGPAKGTYTGSIQVKDANGQLAAYDAGTLAVSTRPGIDTGLYFNSSDLSSVFSFTNNSSTGAKYPGMTATNHDGTGFGGYPRFVARTYAGDINASAVNKKLSGSGKTIGELAFESSDGVSSGAVGASVKAITTAEWSSTNSPTRLSFSLGGGGVGPFGTTEIVSVEADGIHLPSGKKYYGDGSQLTGLPASGLQYQATTASGPLLLYYSADGKAHNSLATDDGTGNINIPAGKTYNINGAAHTHNYQSPITATDKQIIFSDGANNPTGAASLYWDKTNNRLGIGTSAPAAPLDFTSGTASVRLNTPGGLGAVQFFAAGTSIASPTAVSTGAYSAYIQPNFYDGGAYRSDAYTAFQVNGTVSSGSVPTDYIIATGSTSASERLRIQSNGNLRVSNQSIPATTTSAGTAGEIAIDAANGYLYLCTATNTWRRVAINGTW